MQFINISCMIFLFDVHTLRTSTLSFFSGNNNVWPKSSDPFYIVTYYIKWVTTSWTGGTLQVYKAISTRGPRDDLLLFILNH